MKLSINPFQIRTAVANYRAELLKTYTTTTEEGLSALHLVVFGDSTDSTIVRDMLTDAIENQYNYYNINMASDEITIYTFTAIKGYTYCID